MLRLPQAMVALHLLMAPTSYVDKWGLVDVGQLGPAVRLGWFIPSRMEQASPPLYDHWKVFKDLNSLTPFVPSEEQRRFIRERVRRNDERWEFSYLILARKIDVNLTRINIPDSSPQIKNNDITIKIFLTLTETKLIIRCSYLLN